MESLSADAKAILESMGDAFYALDGEWRFIYANRRALDFWGTTATEVIGHVIWQRFSGFRWCCLRQYSPEERLGAGRRMIEYFLQELWTQTRLFALP